MQFLDIRYSAKVPSSSTLDDVRGTLEKCIPDDSYGTESEFLARVEEDAVSFRPHGEKIASYTRVTPSSEKKGKRAVVTLPEDDPDAIVYEAWHVRVPPSRLSLTPLTIISGNVEKPWIPRISPADATVHSSLHRGWLLHQRRGGFVGVCRSVSFPFLVLCSRFPNTCVC